MQRFGRNAYDNKIMNRGKVLELIATGRCRTRNDLVRSMGLTKMAISNIVTELLEKDFLTEEEKTPSKKAGRRSTVLAISPKAPKVIGLLLVRERVEVVLCDSCLNVSFRKSVLINQITDQDLIQIMFTLVEEALAFDSNVIGIGVSCMGPVDSEKGVLTEPPYFYGIRNLPIAKLLETRFSLPVRVNQDNVSGALEEYLYGNGKGHENMMLVGLERGVGCGIIQHGQIRDGFRSFKPEIGHVSIDVKGRRCVCGNRGCLEMYINSEEMKKQFEKICGIKEELADYYSICHESQFSEMMEDMMEKLSSGISTTINLFNLDLVLIGYDGVLLPEKYLNLLQEKINEKIFYSDSMRVIVRKPYYGADAQLLGGACNIIKAVFNGELGLDS